jgi:hypothetical protein
MGFLNEQPHTLRTACIALVYSAAEYCAPVWLNSLHVDKLDVQLNNAMRLITGTVKSTPTSMAASAQQHRAA